MTNQEAVDSIKKYRERSISSKTSNRGSYFQEKQGRYFLHCCKVSVTPKCFGSTSSVKQKCFGLHKKRYAARSYVFRCCQQCVMLLHLRISSSDQQLSSPQHSNLFWLLRSTKLLSVAELLLPSPTIYQLLLSLF